MPYGRIVQRPDETGRRKVRVADVVDGASTGALARGSTSVAWSGVTGKPSVNTTSPLAGGGSLSTSLTLTTSMSTGKLIGRSTAGTGVMEQITVGSGLSLSGGTLSTSGGSSDHAALSNLAWTASGHTGSANKAPYFNGSNVAALYDISASGRSLANATLATGDLVVGTGTATASTLAIGTAGYTLQSVAGAPAWVSPSTARTNLGLNSGSATADFGAFPGGMMTTVTVTGQASIASGSNVRAWIQATDSTSDHNAAEHALLTQYVTVSCTTITVGTGFVLSVFSSILLSGQIALRWAWE